MSVMAALDLDLKTKQARQCPECQARVFLLDADDDQLKTGLVRLSCGCQVTPRSWLGLPQFRS